MEVFNIGPFEFLIILVIMFVLLGPDEMKRTARRIAVSIRKFVRSPIWADITGMREEIRELPKRLMEDTGLDEAVQEIKQTTTAASDEMNAAVKDSVEAARVREVENLRVMTSQKLSPTAGQVIMPPRQPKETDPTADNGGEAAALTSEVEEPATIQAADLTADAAASAAADAVADARAYTLEVDIEPATREPAQDQPIIDTVNTITPPAEVVKKPRRKKADAAPTEASSAEGDAPAPKPRRASRKKTETETLPPAPGTNGSAAENSTHAKDETNQPNAA